MMNLKPLSVAEDAAIVVGAVGLLSGMGGKYFGLIPVVEPPSADWGSAVFSINAPGVWSGPTKGTGTPEGNFFRIPGGPLTGLWIMLGVEAGTIGLDKVPYVNVYQGASQTYYYESYGSKPGPLGKRGGFIFLGLLVGGLLVKLV